MKVPKKKGLSTDTLFQLKPLRWAKIRENTEDGRYYCLSNDSYFIKKLTDREGNVSWSVGYCFDDYYDEGELPAKSLEDAKRVAWVDHCERIGIFLKRVPRK